MYKLVTDSTKHAPTTSLTDLPQIIKDPESHLKTCFLFKKRYFSIIYVPFLLIVLILMVLLILSVFFNLIDKKGNELPSLDAFFNDSIKAYCGRRDFSSVYKSKSNRRARIINGDIEMRENWPWIVSFRYKVNGEATSVHFCAGSIITNEYILTTGKKCVSFFT